MKTALIHSPLPVLFFLGLLTLCSAQFNPTCRGKRYMCDNHNVITEPDMCAFVNDTKNKLHLIKPCIDDTKPFCNFTLASYGSPVYCSASTEEVVLTLPGEYCSANSQCHSGECSSGVCKGVSFNETCTDDRDCDTGMYCFGNTKKCMYQQQFGENCTRDNECTNNCACNKNTCVYYYSFDNFLPADNPLACASGYVQDGTCYPGLISEFKGKPCTSNDECLAYNHQNQLVQNGQCECGFNGGGFTYCTLAEGDPEFQTLKDKFAFIVARAFECHTNLRFGPCHDIYDDEYTEFQIAARYFDMYPQLVFNDPCIKTAITHDFWKFTSGRRVAVDFLVVSVSIILSLFILA